MFCFIYLFIYFLFYFIFFFFFRFSFYHAPQYQILFLYPGCIFLVCIRASSFFIVAVVSQRKKTMLVYENIIFFYYSKLRVRVKVEDGWDACTQGQTVWIFYKTSLPFCTLGQNLHSIYNIPDAHMNSCGHNSSNLLLICCIWSHFLLACHPCNLCGIFIGEHMHPVYFRNQVHILLFLFLVFDFFLACHPCNLHDMSKRVFQSIANISKYCGIIF